MLDVWGSIHELSQPCLLKAVTEPAIDSEGVVKDSILKSIDILLWEDVDRAVLESGVSPFQHESLYTADKWLTTSALQKCIRRGHSELAEQYARSSVRIDPDHAFRRLAIIALEDIGLGNLKMVAATLAVLSDKRRRQRIGEERLAVYLASGMSTAVKSRLACEMLSLVDYNPQTAKLAEPLYGLDAVTLSQIVQNEAFGSTRQIISLWLLLGTNRLQSRELVSHHGYGWRALLGLLGEERAPLIYHYIVRAGLSRCRDSLALPYVLLAKFANQNPLLKTVRSDIPSPELIGSYPSFAYDMHTRIGRLAIKELAVNCSTDLRMTRVRDVGNLIFALEGGLLDERITSCGASDVSQRAKCLELFEEEQLCLTVDGLRGDLVSNLDDIRRRVCVSA